MFRISIDILNITVIPFKIKDDCNIRQGSNCVSDNLDTRSKDSAHKLDLKLDAYPGTSDILVTSHNFGKFKIIWYIKHRLHYPYYSIKIFLKSISTVMKIELIVYTNSDYRKEEKRTSTIRLCFQRKDSTECDLTFCVI